ncbi:hypothetical protein, partial [Lacticaseibacillus nasuensis]|uniref:hypothetical protein n=1 Tax=Lacticaseibacillus nasuensis TaxID=944671 RepID=UPI002245E09F
IGKLASQLQISLSSFRKRKATAGNLRDFRSWPYLIWGFVTAPFFALTSHTLRAQKEKKS